MAESPLRGKVAMVTGAGSPIGLGHAMGLVAQMGYAVWPFQDENLPLEQRLEKTGAPAAWPQLGRQAMFPGR